MTLTFPPTAPTSLGTQIPAYVYRQYSDDENIQAFNASFNGIAQQYLNWFNQINLPIYTGAPISGALLDWVAQGIYGISRPALPYGAVTGIGPLNTWGLNSYVLNSITTQGQINLFTTTDDIFKRIITWFFFKGDGFDFTIIWLKRRIMRFLVGTAGTAPNIDNTYPISVTFPSAGRVAISISLGVNTAITSALAQTFQAAVLSGAIDLPFQFSFSVAVFGPVLGLANDGGVLQVVVTTGWPTSATGLSAGKLWYAGGLAYVIPGHTPNPAAAPVYFGNISFAQLLALTGKDLPTSDPNNVGQLWNNAGVVCVSLG